MSGIPDSAILELTFNCNHSCLFCYAPWLEEPSLYGRELSIPEWIEVAELLIRRGVRRYARFRLRLLREQLQPMHLLHSVSSFCPSGGRTPDFCMLFSE